MNGSSCLSFSGLCVLFSSSLFNAVMSSRHMLQHMYIHVPQYPFRSEEDPRLSPLMSHSRPLHREEMQSPPELSTYQTTHLLHNTHTLMPEAG